MSPLGAPNGDNSGQPEALSTGVVDVKFRNDIRLKDVHRTVAHMRSTKDAVSEAGEHVASKARANLASRRDRNRHSIETEQGIVDYYVHLVGPGRSEERRVWRVCRSR